MGFTFHLMTFSIFIYLPKDHMRQFIFYMEAAFMTLEFLPFYT